VYIAIKQLYSEQLCLDVSIYACLFARSILLQLLCRPQQTKNSVHYTACRSHSA